VLKKSCLKIVYKKLEESPYLLLTFTSIGYPFYQWILGLSVREVSS
jgi:hypothetical protein